MSAPVNLNDVHRAGELARRGYTSGQIAAEIGVHASTVKRWRAAHPEQFARHEPGSEEHRRQVLLDALEHGSLSEQLRAVELLERLGENKRGSGSGRVVVHLGPEICPHCSEPLHESAESETGTPLGTHFEQTRASPS